ncbi:MAG: LysR family transcriptional regulator [Oscillospiraceae bacterium]|nr:LysR family transcriptional regulator [Oscillospiraceae bacterium]
MDISYFREFVMLAETQNFWAAADRLFISQSSLSKHIKSLESSLGAPLFERTSRRVELSEFGRAMLPYAQSIAKLQYDCETAAFNFLHQENTTLEIAMIPILAHYNITEALLQLKKTCPTVQVNIQEADTLQVREKLLNRECEIAIYRDSPAYLEHDPDKEQKLEKLPYARDRLIAVLPPGHPLSDASSVELSQLSEDCFALLQRGSLPYELCQRACREAGFTPNVIFASHNLESILDTVRKGDCVALLFTNHLNFPHHIDFGSQPPFVAIPVSPPIYTTVCLSYRKNDPLSSAAVCFIKLCKQVRAGLMNGAEEDVT